MNNQKYVYVMNGAKQMLLTWGNSSAKTDVRVADLGCADLVFR
jgi:hypothetical protein